MRPKYLYVVGVETKLDKVPAELGQQENHQKECAVLNVDVGVQIEETKWQKDGLSRALEILNQ